MYILLFNWILPSRTVAWRRRRITGSLVDTYMGWLRLVGSIKLYVSFAEYSLFYRFLLQLGPLIVSMLLSEATASMSFDLHTSLLIRMHLFWYMYISFDICTSLLIYVRLFWYMYVSFDICTSLLIYVRLFWYMYVSFDVCTSLLIYVRLFWYVYVSFDICTSLLIYVRLFWYMYVSFDICTSLLMYVRLFWYMYVFFIGLLPWRRRRIHAGFSLECAGHGV